MDANVDDYFLLSVVPDVQLHLWTNKTETRIQTAGAESAQKRKEGKNKKRER